MARRIVGALSLLVLTLLAYVFPANRAKRTTGFEPATLGLGSQIRAEGSRGRHVRQAATRAASRSSRAGPPDSSDSSSHARLGAFWAHSDSHGWRRIPGLYSLEQRARNWEAKRRLRAELVREGAL